MNRRVHNTISVGAAALLVLTMLLVLGVQTGAFVPRSEAGPSETAPLLVGEKRSLSDDCRADPYSVGNLNTRRLSITAGGPISQDTTWQGDVLITDNVVVQRGVTLTVMPGTRVRFQHYRGYREPNLRLSLSVLGRIRANGTAAQPIYFTSDATDPQNAGWPPQNGDWSMVRLKPAAGQPQSSFHYCVFEFAQQGLNVWNSSPDISHSIFRWNNWEGVYFESFCKPAILHTNIYENGYNGLAAEQSNDIELDYTEVYSSGTNGVHIDNSTAIVRRSLIHDNLANGLSVDNNATLRAYGNAVHANSGCGIGFGEGTNTVYVANLDFKGGNGGGNICGPVTWESSVHTPPSSIDIGYTPDQSYALNCIPSDQSCDPYMYVYPDDETRRITRKIGNGLGLTWSLAWHDQFIWTATLWGAVYRLDPQTGNVLESFTLAGSSQPWGMTFDDQGTMWLVDFAERKVFKVDPSTQAIVDSFPSPNPTAGGCKGITWDGTYLNIMGWTSPVIYQMDRAGNLINTINLDSGGGGGIAWDGEHFWVPSGRILKYDAQGHQVGWIYPASEGTWDMTWDGAHLWASQRTNENWSDEKIFQLEILEDHDHAVYLPIVVRNR